MKKSIFHSRGSSLLAIGCTVLALAVLAQLFLIFLRSEDPAESDSAQAVAAYYAADYQAEQIYDRLRRGELPEGVTKQDSIYIYQCPISEEESLLVVLEKTGEDWKVLRWQAVDAGSDPLTAGQ